MKRLLLPLSAAIALSAVAASADDPAITPAAPWKAVEGSNGKAFSIDYPGTGWPGLGFKFNAEPDAFYKISWTASGKEKGTVQNMVLGFNSPEGNPGSDFIPSGSAQRYAGYIHFNTPGEIRASIRLNPGQPASLNVKDISLAKLSAEDLEGNLIPDPDFEDAVDTPAQWIRAYKTKLTELGIEKNPDFLSGEKCMAIGFKTEEGGALGGIQTSRVPVIPGREYELKFWAKADKDFAFVTNIQAWSPFGHKGEHFYKGNRFKAGLEWKEFSFKIAIPSDFEKYPDLAVKLVSIDITGAKGSEETKAYFDNFSFKPLPTAQ